MKKIIAALASIIALGVAATFVSAQSGGGFPSNPTFQKVTVKGATSTNTLNVVNTPVVMQGTGYAWGSGYPAIDIAGDASFSGANAARLTYNGYYNGSSWIYKTTNSAADVEVGIGGSLDVLTAPSGTAGQPITYTQQMFVNTSGVQVGNPTGGGKGVGTVNAASGYYVNGVALSSAQQTAAGGFNQVSGAACTNISTSPRGISACSTNAGGTITTITFSPAFSTAPFCFVSSTAATPQVYVSGVTVPTTTTATVVSSAASAQFWFFCTN